MSPATTPAPKLGKYLLLKKLGGGGMGRVYLASMSGPMEFEKKVVVKTILPSLTENKDYIQLFLNEARLGARLSHSAIASIHELGEENGLYYLVMEYVDGWTLREAIKAAQKAGTTLSPSRVAEIFARACEGLAYAHTLTDKDGKPLGVVHRDLSPQNVMISREGDVKIIDFGVARSDLSTNETVAGAIKGKLSYMSPEQSRGERVDARSDIFALGVLLYEALTNENPFSRDSPVSIIRAIETLEPVALKTIRADLGPFDPIIRRCLQKDKERRYPDARELRMDLLGVIERARASQRDHLGSWVAGILENKAEKNAPTSAEPVERTLVEKLDPFAHPHDPGLDLPDLTDAASEEEGEDNGADEQATRLKAAGSYDRPPAGATVVKPVGRAAAPHREVESGLSHITGLRKGPAPLLFGVIGAVGAIALGAVLYTMATRPPPRLPETAPTDQAGAADLAGPAAPTPTAPMAAAGIAAAPPTPPSPPPTEVAAPAVPTSEPATPAQDEAAAVHHHARHHKSHGSDDGAAAGGAAEAPAGGGGGLIIKAMGDTHASDAYGNPLNPHRSMGASASLQVGNLLVQVKSAMNDGERTISIASQPWSIASVDGVSRGKTPLASIPLPDHGVRVELIRPGMDSAAVLKISPSGN
jgi:serine/threonine-protein kinase